MTILYKRSHFTKPARVSLTSPPGRNNKWVAIINSRRAGGPGHKPLYGCLLRKQEPIGMKPEALVFDCSRLCHEARDSGIQELQQLFLRPLPDDDSI